MMGQVDRQQTIWRVPYDRTQWRRRIDLAAPLAVFLVSVALGYASARTFGEGYASLVFVLGISVIGAMSGMSVALASAVAGAIVFNFLVAAPVYQLNYDKPTDFAPPVVFALSAVLSGWLSGRLKDQVMLAGEGAARLEYLLDASRSLQAATSFDEIIAALRGTSLARSGIAFGLFRRERDALLDVGAEAAPPAWNGIAAAVLAEGRETTRRDTLHGYGLKGSEGTIGVLVAETPADRQLDETFMLPLARIVALALERAQLAAEVVEARTAARAEAFKTSLLSSVSHDLRTPLTTIRTAASSLESFGEGFDAETRAGLLGGIVAECDRLNRLTANLLEMSRIEGGGDSLRPAIVPVGELVRAAAARLEADAQRPRIAVAAPGAEIAIAVDPVLFELALTNVLQNALLYSPPGSAVTVACTAADGLCAIAVTDAGAGIPQSDQPHVFERFYRGNADRAAPKGSGLGLAIARGFVEASGGTIAILSPVRDGRGTAITLTLPLAIESAAA